MSMFDQVGAIAKDLYSVTKKNPFPVVAPVANRQLTKAFPQTASPGSFAGLMNQNNPPAYNQASTKPVNSSQVGTVPGLIPQSNPQPKTQVLGNLDGGGASDHQATVGLLNSQLKALQTSLKNANSQGVNSNDNTTQLDGSGNPVKAGVFPTNGGAAPNNQNSQGNANGTATFPGILGGLINKSSQPSEDYTKIQGLIAENLAKRRELESNYAEAYKNIDTSGVDASLQTGQEGVMGRTLAAKEAALAQEGAGLSSQLGAANTQQGLQQSGLTSAAGLAQPVNQLGLLTNPQTGEPLNPQVASNAVQQAYQLIKNDTDPNDPTVQSLISPFGTWGQQALTSMLNGGGSYNPTTQSAGAQANASQRAQFQQQAAQLGVALEGLSKVGNLADSFLQSTGLNPNTSSFVNAQQNTALGQLKNPANIATYNELVNQVQTYAGQIFASTGMTPTAADGMAKNISIDGMTENALKAFLHNLDIIGQSRKSTLDRGATSDYANGNNSNQGSLQVTPDSNQFYGKGDPALEAIAGGVANFGGDILSLGGAIKVFLGF